MSIEAKLKALGYDIQAAPVGQGKIEPAVRVGNLVFTSGQVSARGEAVYKGKVGSDLSVEEGYQAARVCALNCLAAVKAVFPALQRATVAQHWAGLIDVTPDAVPVISPVDSLPSAFIATGFSGHGFGIGPGAGRLVAELVAGDKPVVDPTPFRLSRFFDGSKIVVEAGF